MNIVFDGKERELKYTFNSFEFMEEFDLGILEEAEAKPFKILPLIRMLLLGALNHNSTEYKTNDNEVVSFLEEYIIENDISELLTELMDLLGESNFFKSLQKKKIKAKKK